MNWYKTAKMIDSLSVFFQNEISDAPYKSLSAQERNKVDKHIKQRKKEVEKQVNSITDTPYYQRWIYNLIGKKSLIFPEDIDKTKQILKQYDILKRSSNFPQEYKDINVFETYGQLSKVISELSKESKTSVFDFGNNEVIYNKDNIQIIELLNYEKAYPLLEDTGWCVKDKHYFNDYYPPYYVFIKDNKKFALLHFDSHQFKDVHDDPIVAGNMTKPVVDAFFDLFNILGVPLSVKNDFNVMTKINKELLTEEHQNEIKEVTKQYWVKRISDDLYAYEHCPHELINLPEIQEAYKQGWIKDLSKGYYNYEYCPERFKNLPEIQEAYKQGWIKAILNGSGYYNDCPEEIKNSLELKNAFAARLIKYPYYYESYPREVEKLPEIKEARKQGWINYITDNPNNYKSCPEEFKQLPEILAVANKKTAKNMSWYKSAKLSKDVRKTNMVDWALLHKKMINVLGIDYDLTKKSEKYMDEQMQKMKIKAEFEMYALGEAIQKVTDKINTEDDPNWIVPTEQQIAEWWLENYPNNLPRNIGRLEFA